MSADNPIIVINHRCAGYKLARCNTMEKRHALEQSPIVSCRVMKKRLYCRPLARFSLVTSITLAFHAIGSLSSWGQIAEELPAPSRTDRSIIPSMEVIEKEATLIAEVLDPELVFKIEPTRSRILRARIPITRVSITDPSIIEVSELSPTDLEVIGMKAGETTLTLWFKTATGEDAILRYLVEVGSDEAAQKQIEVEYGKLEKRINELFPYSRIQLIPVADKLIIRGDARDATEAAQIMAILGGQGTDQDGNLVGSAVNAGQSASIPTLEKLPAKNIIDLLRVPGEQQVLLKVRIAEVSRSAARELGVNLDVMGNAFELASSFGSASNLAAILDSGDVELFIRAFSSNGIGKILAEPNLVTLSGQPANFIAGGEFPVPTAVGVDGIGAVATNFRGFGTQLTFVPSVIDKDRIRLNVSPSFSSVNNDLTNNDGTPGLNIRGANTTVELREGQWLAIAGLIQEQTDGSRSRVPYLGDIPIIGSAFGNQTTGRDETELVILVSPELVHPLEPEQAPLFLPGMDVTEPTPKEFWLHQQIEGLPGEYFRSTIWPSYRNQLHHMNKDMRQAEHGVKRNYQYQDSQDYYMFGPQGFSK